MRACIKDLLSTCSAFLQLSYRYQFGSNKYWYLTNSALSLKKEMDFWIFFPKGDLSKDKLIKNVFGVAKKRKFWYLELVSRALVH